MNLIYMCYVFPAFIKDVKDENFQLQVHKDNKLNTVYVDNLFSFT